MTIGTDTALHRIIEAIDAIVSTAYSHQRAFIMEVMGRHCGYLGLAAALSCEADFLFIPEDPVQPDWREKICKSITTSRASGQRLNIIIVAEGAIDINNKPIKVEEVRDVIIEGTKTDTRVTVLGHVQRGGSPSAFDRILGCRMGLEAVIALAEALPESESIVISLNKNEPSRIPLMEGVRMTQNVQKAMNNKDFETAQELRGPSFKKSLKIYKMLAGIPSNSDIDVAPIEKDYRFGIIHIGAPACGMNSVTHSFTRMSLIYSNRVFAIHDGIEGLIEGKFQELKWGDVSGWVSTGGSLLGVKSTLPEGKCKEIAERLREFNIQGLLIVGGFAAFHACGQLADERPNYPEFRIPLVVVPATISNNVPGTEFSIGSDSALNVVTEICDRIRQSAQGTKRRVFVIETMGGYCGYLATLAAIAGGADSAYIHEQQITIKDIQTDIKNISAKINLGANRGLILRNEMSSENYNTDFIHRVYSEEGKGTFTCRQNIIGHMQQGGNTTPFDRNLGSKLGSKCVTWMLEQIKSNMQSNGKFICNNNESACVVGMIKREYKYTPVIELLQEADFLKQLPKNQWWLKLRPMIQIFSKCNTHYNDIDVVYN